MFEQVKQATSRPDGTNENEVESGVSSAVGGSPNLFSDHAIVATILPVIMELMVCGVLACAACMQPALEDRRACLNRIYVQNPKTFQDFSSHRIFIHMHRILNINKNKN